eukprot:13146563-Alexandrium_andersonii.AAC.1
MWAVAAPELQRRAVAAAEGLEPAPPSTGATKAEIAAVRALVGLPEGAWPRLWRAFAAWLEARASAIAADVPSGADSGTAAVA